MKPRPPDAPRILVVDDEENTRKSLTTFLRYKGYASEAAPDAESALKKLGGDSFHIVLTDLKLAGMDGIRLTERVKSEHPNTEVVIMTAYGTVRNAVEAVKKGAFDYLMKPLDHEELLITLVRAEETRALRQEVKRLTAERVHFGLLVGESPSMQRVYDAIEKAAGTDVTVLIAGETGTGKEMIARAIHTHSPRKRGPFVAVSCAALPEGLVESELFGHIRGAFTGAERDKPGRFEAARGGTILLDEVTTMPPHVQAKLLRVLQEKKAERVGSNTSLDTDVRVITIVNEDPLAAVRMGRFREDLYYRVNVISIHPPPLRDRKEDIPLLVEHFLEKHTVGMGRLTVAPRVMDILLKHSWPGNVRELENAVERMVAVSSGGSLTENHLPEELRSIGLLPWEETARPFTWKKRVESFEKYLIMRKLHETGGKILDTARSLGLPLRTLRRKMARFSLRKQAFKKSRP